MAIQSVAVQMARQLRHRARAVLARWRPERVGAHRFAPFGAPFSRLGPSVELSKVVTSPTVNRRAVAVGRRAEFVVVSSHDDASKVWALAASGCATVSPDGAAFAKRNPELGFVLPDTSELSCGGLVRAKRLSRLRRDAWRELGGEHRPLSVLLATNRPEDVGHAAAQLSEQVGHDFQLVVGMHGSGFSSQDKAAFRAVSEHVIVEEFDTSFNLGQVLASLSDRADGELLTKWDDDDFYSGSHLEDMVLAQSYSGAEIVGKSADFVYLEGGNVTVRRSSTSETFHMVLAGGTLLLSRDVLRSCGGWPDAPRHVDRLLIDAIVANGGWSYRTHPFGYVLRRRAGGAGHTWSASDEYFWNSAVEIRQGLDLVFAGVAAEV
jgi:hypothetical protein